MNASGPRGQSPQSPSELPMHDFARLLEGLIAGTIQFEMHTQAIVDLRRGVVAGYEALSRFTGAADISPDRVLAVAGLLDKRLELEAIMARKALMLRESLPPSCFLSVNVSPELLLSAHWEELQSEFTNFAATCFEITEQEAISDYNAIRKHVERIRKAGGCVAVDDTGSGYASLKHVMELRPDFIKLDRLFVNACHLEAAKRTMIQLLGDTADRLNAWIVAEGVENKAELDELLVLKVPLAQGWYLAEPQPGMQPIALEKAEYIRLRTAELDHSRSVFQYTEVCPSAATEEQARNMMQTKELLTEVFVVDDWNRPLALLERHALLGVRRLENLLRVPVMSAPEEVLRRAVERPQGENFDPVAAINERGELQGVIYIDRLVRGILAEHARSNAQTRSTLQGYTAELRHAHAPKQRS